MTSLWINVFFQDIATWRGWVVQTFRRHWGLHFQGHLRRCVGSRHFNFLFFVYSLFYDLFTKLFNGHSLWIIKQKMTSCIISSNKRLMSDVEGRHFKNNIVIHQNRCNWFSKTFLPSPWPKEVLYQFTSIPPGTWRANSKFDFAFLRGVHRKRLKSTGFYSPDISQDLGLLLLLYTRGVFLIPPNSFGNVIPFCALSNSTPSLFRIYNLISFRVSTHNARM
jgi:hypothetical protein